MQIVGFTPLSAALGGALIGVAASALLALNGQVAGISGILGGLLTPADGDRSWRFAFLGGLGVGGVILARLAPSAFEPSAGGLVRVVIAGLLVGFGTRLGNGCTSGHGVCGIARGSTRSIVATATFMAVALGTVFVVRHVVGEAP